jgi:hypothetical protein
MPDCRGRIANPGSRRLLCYCIAAWKAIYTAAPSIGISLNVWGYYDAAPQAGEISTIAGTGTQGYFDDGTARDAEFNMNAAHCLTLTTNASVTANFKPNPISTSSALRFVPVTPCRLVDTRNVTAALGGPSIGPAAIRSFPIPGACGILGSALAYSLNLTVVPHGSLGYVSMWPTGQAQPVVSTLNSLDGRI